MGLRSFTILFLTLAPSLAEKEISFNEDIRPLFSNSCYHCHGPDEETQEAGLRLDTFEGATANNDGVRGIIPGDPMNSEAFIRLISEDPDTVMPPPKHGDPFTPEQVETVKKWIEQGAPYEKHWAYNKPEVREVPKVENAPEEWTKNPIDAFILKKLEENELSPSAPADLRTLARRSSLDLTGLPPTPEEVETLLSDSSADAFSNYVDTLLAKPDYGEHWARMWLDLARYADSAGYADDPPRVIWAYRDYVIKAFNENMPFDQFTREQLAGDLLPDPTEDQIIATAFNRNTQTNNEGGTNDEEFRNVAVVDRVNTTMATWMGTTMACAQCHTHKYDPITHAEYFQLFDILNQTLDSDKKNEAPVLSLFTGAGLVRKKELEERIQTLHEGVISKKFIPEEFTKWESELKKKETVWHPVKPSVLKTREGTTLTALPDHSILASGSFPDTDTYLIDTEINPQELSQITGIKIEVLPDPSFPKNGPGRNENGNFVINHFNISSSGNSTPKKKARFVRVQLLGKDRLLHFAELQAFANGENVALKGTARQSSTNANGDAKRAIDGITNGKYGRASVTHTGMDDNAFWEVDLNSEESIDKIVLWNRTDGGLQKRLSDYKLMLLDKDRNLVWEKFYKKFPTPMQEATIDNIQYGLVDSPQSSASFEQKNYPIKNLSDPSHDRNSGWAIMGGTGKKQEAVLKLERPIPAGHVSILLKQTFRKHSLGKFRLYLTSDPLPKHAFKKAFLTILNTPASQRTPEQTKIIQDYYHLNNPAFIKERKDLSHLKAQLTKLKPNTTLPVMEEVKPDKRRETHIHLRGSYLSKGPKVSAGFPKELSPEGFNTENDLPNRLDLANWLLHENNPLTARVAANRFWEKMFGIGIVATSEEFGSQGEPPSHPELLDWLALELRDSGWDVKQLLKLIVTSAAYQQNSHVTAQMHADDPANRLVARGPRVRLSAEMIRDQALEVSGLLSKKMYGNPVNPPQPDMGLKAAFGGNLDWVSSAGEDKFRRGLYTTWRRSNPYPSMATFDAPNREVCVVKRDRTNTPLQALVTLNDPVYVEAAQALARRLSNETSTLEEQLSLAFHLALSRPPTDLERTRLSTLYNEALEEYTTNQEAAKEMATNPIGDAPQGYNHAHLASLTLVSNVILNLDEILMKR